MPASPTQRQKKAERKAIAFRLYLDGKQQLEIAEQLGVSVPCVSKLIKEACQENPVVEMTPQQRTGLAMELILSAHGDIRRELASARAEGRRDDVRGLLSVQSLSAARAARVLEATPEAVVQAGPVFNVGNFAALMGGAQQQQLPSETVEPVTVEVQPEKA